MPLSLLIAFRYFLAKKSTSAITIILWIAISAIAVGVAALIVVLSVFNGFETLVKTLYHSFNSDLQLSPASGKMILMDSVQLNKIKKLEAIENLCCIIEENALLKYGDKQFIVTLQGVDSNFNKVNDINQNMYAGVFKLHTTYKKPTANALSSFDLLNEESVDTNVSCMVMGAGIAQALALNPDAGYEPIQVKHLEPQRGL
jgi:ABC-type lipoprotein release transport system permease subunit